MLVLPVAAAVDLFASRLMAFDVIHDRDARGVSAPGAQQPDRPIAGAFQPFGETRGRWLPEGVSPDAARVLHTSAPIYAAAPHSGGSQARQTYVRFGGDLWKIWQAQDWGQMAGGLQRYVATKYVDPNGVIT